MPCIATGFAAICAEDEVIIAKAWFAKVVTVDGQEFVAIDRQSKMCSHVIGDNFAMLDELIKLRNMQCGKLMSELATQNDPLLADSDSPGSGPLPKRAKKEMLDDIDQVMSVTAAVQGGAPVTVKVLASATERSKLVIELTDKAIALLASEPEQLEGQYGDDPTPTVQEEHAFWVKSRSSVRSFYFDGDSWKVKSMKVARGTCSFAEFQEKVNKMAKVVEEFYLQHHVEECVDADSQERDAE
ncbi:unnamed protein product [Prorocentrum cordatum]|uniref:Uncharacterized protein n=1 Tax=Prorocentrum cordatum TaxID=2364126 RepID=A0ABN9TG60_9DINO|nr:unnamed protein product [Polarella glacialis]